MSDLEKIKANLKEIEKLANDLLPELLPYLNEQLQEILRMDY